MDSKPPSKVEIKRRVEEKGEKTWTAFIKRREELKRWGMQTRKAWDRAYVEIIEGAVPLPRSQVAPFGAPPPAIPAIGIEIGAFNNIPGSDVATASSPKPGSADDPRVQPPLPEPAWGGHVSQALAETTPDDLRRDVLWAYQNADLLLVKPSDAPSGGALFWLRLIRSSDTNRASFANVVKQLLPRPKDSGDDDGMDDDGRGNLQLIEDCRQEFERAKDKEDADPE